MAAKDHTANDRAYDERANEEEEEKKRKGSKPLEQKMGVGIQGSDTNLEWKRQLCAATQGFTLSHAWIEGRKKEKQKEGKERRIAENGGNDVKGKTQGVKANKS